MRLSTCIHYLIVSFVFSGFVLASSGFSTAQDLRTWTSANGKFTFEATLISHENGKLELKGRDGKVKKLDASQLSEKDRSYLKDLSKSEPGDSDTKISKEQKDSLKEFGLRLARDEFVFLDERKLKSEISKSLKAKKKLVEMEIQLEQGRVAQLKAQNQILGLRQQNVQLNTQLSNAGSVRENNRLVGAINANESSIQLLQTRIDELDKQIKEGRSFANKSREEFVDFVMGVRKLSDSFHDKAASLEGDDSFQALRGELEESLGRKLEPVGESRSLARLRTNLTKLEKVVLVDSIKLVDDGSGTYEATVSINGQEPIELVVDSGASLVTVPSSLASKLKIDMSNLRPVNLSIADGSTIRAKLVVLETVRLGKFTAKNVECAVLGPEAVNAPNLLGMSFLGNFKFEIDAAKGELKMMTVNTEED